MTLYEIIQPLYEQLPDIVTQIKTAGIGDLSAGAREAIGAGIYAASVVIVPILTYRWANPKNTIDSKID
jgi:hypothetical protein